MDFQAFLKALEDVPIIAAVKDEKDLPAALKSNARVVFLLCGSILDIGELTRRTVDAGKVVFVHLDLVEGLTTREVSVDFIARNTAAHGVISTRAALVRYARKFGLLTIQRFFLLDSIALNNLESACKRDELDIVEVLPGLMHSITTYVTSVTAKPVIASGLIRSKEDVIAALNAGALAVSATNPQVWYM